MSSRIMLRIRRVKKMVKQTLKALGRRSRACRKISSALPAQPVIGEAQSVNPSSAVANISASNHRPQPNTESIIAARPRGIQIIANTEENLNSFIQSCADEQVFGNWAIGLTTPIRAIGSGSLSTSPPVNCLIRHFTPVSLSSSRFSAGPGRTRRCQ